MLEVTFTSTDNVKVLYDDKSMQTPCEIDAEIGEHRLEIFTGVDNIKQIKVFDQTLDRKKALRLDNSLLFVFDMVHGHANFSKHTGSFGTAMLRKDRIKIDD